MLLAFAGGPAHAQAPGTPESLAGAAISVPAAGKTGPAARTADWGEFEADLDRVMPAARAYLLRMSDLRDAGASPDPCGKSLGLDGGRRGLARMAEAARRQLAMPAAPDDRREARLRALVLLEDLAGRDDKYRLRVMTELRGTFTADQLARKMGKPLTPDIAAIFAPPMSESEVAAQLRSIELRAAMLAAAHASERARLANASYAGNAPGKKSEMEQQARAQLDARMEAARTALCAPALAYFHRGLVAFIDPLVPKWRAHVLPRIGAAPAGIRTAGRRSGY